MSAFPFLLFERVGFNGQIRLVNFQNIDPPYCPSGGKTSDQSARLDSYHLRGVRIKRVATTHKLQHGNPSPRSPLLSETLVLPERCPSPVQHEYAKRHKPGSNDKADHSPPSPLAGSRNVKRVNGRVESFQLPFCRDKKEPRACQEPDSRRFPFGEPDSHFAVSGGRGDSRRVIGFLSRKPRCRSGSRFLDCHLITINPGKGSKIWLRRDAFHQHIKSGNTTKIITRTGKISFIWSAIWSNI